MLNFTVQNAELLAGFVYSISMYFVHAKKKKKGYPLFSSLVIQTELPLPHRVKKDKEVALPVLFHAHQISKQMAYTQFFHGTY
jgi:hypothetical protein